jgi:hypothetical protein
MMSFAVLSEKPAVLLAAEIEVSRSGWGPSTIMSRSSMSLIARTQVVKIVLLCTLATIAFGVVHDQITAHLCVEYFTIAHPPIFHVTSPALLGLCWGIAASIGPGIIVGVLLALVSQSAGLPPTPVRTLLGTICVLLAIMALSATLAGIIGYELSRRSVIALPASFKELVPVGQHDRFMAVWFAHAASYLVGLGGSSFVIFRIWLRRGRPHVLTAIPRTKGGILRTLILAAIVVAVVWLRLSGQ